MIKVSHFVKFSEALSTTLIDRFALYLLDKLFFLLHNLINSGISILVKCKRTRDKESGTIRLEMYRVISCKSFTYLPLFLRINYYTEFHSTEEFQRYKNKKKTNLPTIFPSDYLLNQKFLSAENWGKPDSVQWRPPEIARAQIKRFLFLCQLCRPYRCASMSSEAGAPEAASKIDRQASVYVFPGPGCQHYTASSTQSADASSSASAIVPNVFAKGGKLENDNAENEELGGRGRRRPFPRTHARSASHGGMLAECLTSTTGFQPYAGSHLGPLSAISGTRPSALKKPGHQRAFSQGQVVEVQGHATVTGHSRVGSKTDFILPPGHKEDSKPPTAGKVPSFRGHSRQASRYGS